MMNFDVLVNNIQETHATLQQSAIKAINKHLTIRNWLIGFYIVEFEQNGEDRAKYGEKLLDDLAYKLDIKGLGARNLKLFRQFYFLYPSIVQTASAQLKDINFRQNKRTISSTFDKLELKVDSGTSNTISESEKGVYTLSGEVLISKLSFSHLTLLLPIKEQVKRSFYEIQCIQGNWSVNELKRQIRTLYFERSGMSLNPEKLSLEVHENSDQIQIGDIIKSPFTFEFLGLRAKEVVYENDLEQALVDHLEEFLIELGHGFCFEAKQKRIIIGDEYFFIDLVFYHRILKCHVLIELKTNEVKHEHIGQLKTYINYFKKEIMLPGDNPPVGILLVTDQNKALVEYAVADSDIPLFVSKYVIELPSKEQLEIFIKNELRHF
ncbi:YhcG family protein [Dyadobacter sp. CY356]|uniref:PDDEXK nuclease domain-containing protein n=1 Tax=Dyadobacter sp. CY356 TaxID=2906442 RepID=UPI001F3374F1|nr:PDDEXK nuclease domain-containing protein [Dyadobacter sp. CY356]MCF0056923.1 PDDEXK nuclease domain-containing protein [Dyadobacter sp. CY356]